MKRKVLIYILIVTFMGGLGIVWNAFDPAVYWEEMVDAYIPMHDEYRTGMVSGEWIPFYARWNPKIFFSLVFRPNIEVTFGFPTMDHIYIFYQEDQRSMIITLHVFNKFVRGVKISYKHQMVDLAQSIKKNILADHPRMPVLMKESVVFDGELEQHKKVNK